VPAVLKNAIDSVFVTFGFRNKPFGCVAYSGAITGGTRAVDHLAHIGVEAEMVALRNNLLFPRVGDAFDEAGEPKDPMSNLAMSIFLDDLVWWGDALKVARNQSVLPPAFFRQMAAQAAAGAQGEQLVNPTNWRRASASMTTTAMRGFIPLDASRQAHPCPDVRGCVHRSSRCVHREYCVTADPD